MVASRSGSGWVVAFLAICLLVAACGDDGSGPARVDLVVTTATTGLDIDPDGYEVVVEGLGVRSIGPSGTVTFEDVPSGDYLVELTGVPENCSLMGQNPRAVTAGSSQPLAGRFEVACVANLGAIAVTVSSTGTAVPDTYTLIVDDTVTQPVDANGVTVLDGVPAREVAAVLSLPSNCSLEGGNPRMLAVPFDDVVPTTFEVSCSPDEGALQVLTSTNGGDLDPDGYVAVVDDTLSEHLGVNEVVTFELIPAGNRSVELKDLAANCAVMGENPRTVTVAFGDTVSTTFEVECDPNGDVEVATETTGMNLPTGFTAVLNGGPDQVVVGPNGKVMFDDLPAGEHTIELTDIPSHCEVVEGANPRTVTVTGGLGSTTFVLKCWAWLVFDSDRTGSFDVFIMRHDGAEQTNLTNHPDDDRQPVVSPDGTRVAFASFRSGTEHIHVMDLETKVVTQLTTGSTRAKEPYWSPDGSKIVYSGRTGSQRDIWVMNHDGTGQVNLTDHPATDGRAEWSPDGTMLVFDSERDGQRDVYVMDADGGNPVRLTTQGGGNPTWSPDGTKIAYTGLVDGTLDVWVMNADGSGQVNLTNLSGGTDGEAAWSPDGTTIAFATERHGSFEIYLMNPDGGDLRRLTFSSSDDMWPSWSR